MMRDLIVDWFDCGSVAVEVDGAVSAAFPFGAACAAGASFHFCFGMAPDDGCTSGIGHLSAGVAAPLVATGCWLCGAGDGAA